MAMVPRNADRCEALRGIEIGSSSDASWRPSSRHFANWPDASRESQCRYMVHRLTEQDHGEGLVAGGGHIPISFQHGYAIRTPDAS